jgi:MFS family permease
MMKEEIEQQGQRGQHDVPEIIPRGKGLLINRNFALLSLGQAISNLGDFVYTTTLLIWVFALTHSSVAASGVVLAQYVPIFLLGPFAGVFVDRWNRRRTMVLSDAARMIIALLPLAVPLFLRLPAIYTSVFLISALSRFFMPAKSGVLQVIVAGEQQAQATSISQTGFALSFVIGPAIAGPLYAFTGPVIALLINAASYLISALSIASIHASRRTLHPYASKRGEHRQQEQGGVRAVVSDLAAGFRFVLETRVLLVVVLMAMISMLGAGALNALDIVFANRNLHVTAQLYGTLVAVCGLGTLVGAILAGLLSKWVKSQYILTGGVFLLGLGIVVYALQTRYLVALVVSFIMCIPQGGIDVGFGPLLLNSTPQHLIGRTMSMLETAMYGASLISIAVAGYAGQFVPVNVIFVVCGSLLALGGLFGLFAIPANLPTVQTTVQAESLNLSELVDTSLASIPMLDTQREG